MRGQVPVFEFWPQKIAVLGGGFECLTQPFDRDDHNLKCKQQGINRAVVFADIYVRQGCVPFGEKLWKAVSALQALTTTHALTA